MQIFYSNNFSCFVSYCRQDNFVFTSIYKNLYLLICVLSQMIFEPNEFVFCVLNYLEKRFEIRAKKWLYASFFTRKKNKQPLVCYLNHFVNQELDLSWSFQPTRIDCSKKEVVRCTVW